MPRLSMFFIAAVAALASLCAVSGSRHFSPIQLQLPTERFHPTRLLNDVAPNTALLDQLKPFHQLKLKVGPKTASIEETEPSDHQAYNVPALFEPFSQTKSKVASKTATFKEAEHSDHQAYKKVPTLFEPFSQTKFNVASKTASFEEPEHSNRQAYKKVVSDINTHGEKLHESLRPSQVNKYEWQIKKSLGTAKAIVARMIAMYNHSR